MDASRLSDSDLIQPGKQRAVFAKFLAKEILGEQGRLLFSLLNAFVMSGYHVSLFDNFSHEEMGKYGQLAFSLNHLNLTHGLPTDTTDTIYLFDNEDRAVGRYVWRKKVQVKFDIFSPYWFTEAIFVPFPVHPFHAGPDLPVA